MNPVLTRQYPRGLATTDTRALVSHLRTTHLNTVFAYAQRRLPTRDDAEDATAETFTAAFHAIRRCPADPAAQRPWLLGIARRKVADLLRKRYRQRETPFLVDLPDHAPSPEATALRREDVATLRRAVLALTSDQREALLLKYTDGLSLAEVGAVLGKSEAAVSSLLQRARAAVMERTAYHFLPEERS